VGFFRKSLFQRAPRGSAPAPVENVDAQAEEREEMTYLETLSASAREELRAFIQNVVHAELERRGRAAAEKQWLTTEEAAQMLGTSTKGIQNRLSRGWLRADTTRDGKRILIRRAALLEDLERKTRRRR
jgi:excisionase family DNA binding protein